MKRFECRFGVVLSILWSSVAWIGLACQTASAEAPTTVILISLDGTRPVDVMEATLPSLVRLGQMGVRAAALVPVDPTNTFPSHVSLVTGVRPEVHRLVNNIFIDPVRGRFFRDDPHSWIESEPIWSIAERHGIPTASFHWVGSEGPWAGGPGPRVSRTFSTQTLEKTKVNQILKWLAIEDPLERPRLITSWFHGADHTGHISGPDAKAVAKTLAPQDVQIARLVHEIEKQGLFDSTTLIFVSDHGMVLAPVRLNLEKRLRKAGLKLSLLGVGGFGIGVFDKGKGSTEDLAQAVQIARESGLEAWPRTQAPMDWHVNDPRFGDFVVRAPVGTAIVSMTTMIDGFHGYAAEEPSMAGLLVARGRGVGVGVQLGHVSSLAIAPTILTLLGLPIPPQMTEPPIAELTVGIARADPNTGEVPE